MTDIRGLTISAGWLALIAGNAPAPGFTTGKRYPVATLGIDCQPIPPVVYALVINDAAALVAVKTSDFTAESKAAQQATQ